MVPAPSSTRDLPALPIPSRSLSSSVPHPAPRQIEASLGGSAIRSLCLLYSPEFPTGSHGASSASARCMDREALLPRRASVSPIFKIRRSDKAVALTLAQHQLRSFKKQETECGRPVLNRLDQNLSRPALRIDLLVTRRVSYNTVHSPFVNYYFAESHRPSKG